MALMTVQSFYLEAHGYNYKTSVTTEPYFKKKDAELSSHLVHCAFYNTNNCEPEFLVSAFQQRLKMSIFKPFHSILRFLYY